MKPIQVKKRIPESVTQWLKKHSRIQVIINHKCFPTRLIHSNNVFLQTRTLHEYRGRQYVPIKMLIGNLTNYPLTTHLISNKLLTIMKIAQ